ncbi:MAG TPA: Urease accessory protein [Nitrososphaera sp.]|jgi:urease accessory protein UreE
MLAVTSVAGNIFIDRRLSEKYRRAKAAGKCERLAISRMEVERLRLRRRTDRGTDVGIVLEPGSKLHHGDVLAAERFIVIEQLPEKVVTIGIKKDDIKQMVGLAALIGHTIGNRHRPIAVNNGVISFPVQVESEVDTFKNLLPAGVKLKVKEQLFIPFGEVHSHE